MQLIAQCYHYLFWGALLLLGAGLIAVLSISSART